MGQCYLMIIAAAKEGIKQKPCPRGMNVGLCGDSIERIGLDIVAIGRVAKTA